MYVFCFIFLPDCTGQVTLIFLSKKKIHFIQGSEINFQWYIGGFPKSYLLSSKRPIIQRGCHFFGEGFIVGYGTQVNPLMFFSEAGFNRKSIHWTEERKLANFWEGSVAWN